MHGIIPTAAQSVLKAPSVNPGPSLIAPSIGPTVGSMAQVSIVAVPVQPTDDPRWSQTEPSHKVVCSEVRFWHDPRARHAISVVAAESEHTPEISDDRSPRESGWFDSRDSISDARFASRDSFSVRECNTI